MQNDFIDGVLGTREVQAVSLSDYRIYEKGTFGPEEYVLDWEKGCCAEVTEVEFIGLCMDARMYGRGLFHGYKYSSIDY